MPNYHFCWLSWFEFLFCIFLFFLLILKVFSVCMSISDLSLSSCSCILWLLSRYSFCTIAINLILSITKLYFFPQQQPWCHWQNVMESKNKPARRKTGKGKDRKEEKREAWGGGEGLFDHVLPLFSTKTG